VRDLQVLWRVNGTFSFFHSKEHVAI
jgi:hypothetical protein